MGPVRNEVMWQAVLDAVELAGGGQLDVLDLGGGTGGDAVRLAAAGHRVTSVDPSPDALASLHRRGVDADLGQPVRGILGDSSDLADHVDPASFDLVVCHGVLEHVEDQDQALGSIVRVLRPGGLVSVVVPGRAAAVLARALAGDFAAASAIFSRSAAEWDRATDGPRRYDVGEVAALLDGHGFTTVAVRGLRVFTDLVPSAFADGETVARIALYDLERLVSTSEEFVGLSAGLQALARLDLSSASPDRGGNSAAL